MAREYIVTKGTEVKTFRNLKEVSEHLGYTYKWMSQLINRPPSTHKRHPLGFKIEINHPCYTRKYEAVY